MPSETLLLSSAPNSLYPFLTSAEVRGIMNRPEFQPRRPWGVSKSEWPGTVARTQQEVRRAVTQLQFQIPLDLKKPRPIQEACKGVIQLTKDYGTDREWLRSDAVISFRREIASFLDIRIHIGRHQDFSCLLEILRTYGGGVSEEYLIVSHQLFDLVRRVIGGLVHSYSGSDDFSVVERDAQDGRRRNMQRAIGEFLAEQAGLREVRIDFREKDRLGEAAPVIAASSPIGRKPPPQPPRFNPAPRYPVPRTETVLPAAAPINSTPIPEFRFLKQLPPGYPVFILTSDVSGSWPAILEGREFPLDGKSLQLEISPGLTEGSFVLKDCDGHQLTLWPGDDISGLHLHSVP